MEDCGLSVSLDVRTLGVLLVLILTSYQSPVTRQWHTWIDELSS